MSEVPLYARDLQDALEEVARGDQAEGEAPQQKQWMRDGGGQT